MASRSAASAAARHSRRCSSAPRAGSWPRISRIRTHTSGRGRVGRGGRRSSEAATLGRRPRHAADLPRRGRRRATDHPRGRRRLHSHTAAHRRTGPGTRVGTRPLAPGTRGCTGHAGATQSLSRHSRTLPLPMTPCSHPSKLSDDGEHTSHVAVRSFTRRLGGQRDAAGVHVDNSRESSSPSVAAHATASERECTPSLRYSSRVCVLTVLSDR